MIRRTPLAFLLLPAGLLMLAACASKPEPRPVSSSSASTTADGDPRAEITNEFEASSLVTAVSPAERVVTLKREDGTLIDVVCGPEVRNFAQIAVGDSLRVRFKESLAATKLPPGSTAAAGQAALAGARTKQGDKPGIGAGVVASVRVKIESIDNERGIVTFSKASGELISHRVQTATGRDFVKKLKVGDAVQLDYGRSLALTVEKL